MSLSINFGLEFEGLENAGLEIDRTNESRHFATHLFIIQVDPHPDSR